MADLVTITQTLKRKKVGLRILVMNLDTTTPTGRLMLNLLAWIVHEAGRHAWKLTATWPRSSLLSFPSPSRECRLRGGAHEKLAWCDRDKHGCLACTRSKRSLL